MSRLIQSKIAAAAVFLALSGIASAAEKAPEISRAQALLKAGKAEEAYALLRPLEFFQAGDPSYDYLLGVSALDSGEFNAATLAFERVLAVNPNHAGARMDMARAYFELKDYGRATDQFNAVLTLSPPPNVKKVAEAYLEQIEAKLKARLPSFTAYVEGALGYDTNITNVTSDFTGAVFQSFGLAGIQPLGNSISREDAYVGINTGFLYTLPKEQDDSLVFGLDARQKEYFSEHDFRSSSLSGQLGYNFKREQNTYRIGASVQRFLQDGVSTTARPTTLNSLIYGISGSWQHLLDKRTQASLYAQYNLVRYDDIPSSETNVATIGAALTKSIDAPLTPLLFVSVFYTEEHAQNKQPNGTDLSKKIVGVRAAGQLTLDANIDAYASLGYQFRDDTDLGARRFSIYGKDELADITLGVKWKLDKDWSVRPQVTYTRNDSNIAIYSSNRTDYSITVRKDFR